MNPLYRSPQFTDELLLACGVLREVGIDDVADRFREAVFDRPLTDVALQELRQRIRSPSRGQAPDQESPWAHEADHAKQTALRTLQRLERLLA